MSHYVTIYLQQEDNYQVIPRVVSKCHVPQFIGEHTHVPCLIVCDPRERTNTTYVYGKIQRIAS